MATRYSTSLREQIDTLNRHDARSFANFYSETARVDDPMYEQPLSGRDAIAKDMSDFIQAFPDLSFSVKSVVESGGNTVAFEGVGKGTHRGPIPGPTGEIPATNRPMQFRFAAFQRLNDQGLIEEEHRYYDLAGMMQQLGVTS